MGSGRLFVRFPAGENQGPVRNRTLATHRSGRHYVRPISPIAYFVAGANLADASPDHLPKLAVENRTVAAWYAREFFPG